MADALLGIAIEKLTSIVWKEVSTFRDFNQLKDKLTGNLTAIRAVLKDAEEKQIKSHAVKDWLQKLTDAAYVLDDILDECSIKSNQARGCITHFNPNRILARCDLGKRMKDIAKWFDDIAEERSKFELRGGIMESHQEDDDEWRQTSSVITEPKVYGRDHDVERVVEFLLRHPIPSEIEEEVLSVYSIVGMGGPGKTTLAQHVFNDQRVRNHFELKIWVCVSDDFSIMKILQSIVEFITGQNPNILSLESMKKRVQELLQSKSYLLVLDDVWNELPEKWDKFKSLLQQGKGTKGASILVTTRLETVASIMGTHPAHLLGGLSEDDIWSLLKQHAFGPNREERAELVKIGKDIAKKCVGSPLAAKALGGLLYYKSEEYQWLAVNESEFWDLPQDIPIPIMPALRLSYFNLKLSLRPCFSFCAIFPKDFEMVKENLIHLWMANGFISSRGNLEVEHVGNEVWDELYQRSFFQEVKTDEKGNITFKMHDLIHDLAQSIMGEECVVSKAASLTNLSKRVHHIRFLLDPDNKINYNIVPFKKVESLRTYIEFEPPYSNLSVLPSIISLRALSTSSFQLSALKNLTHLRYLQLYRSYITTLPKSICRLPKLQILKLKSCKYLSTLPKQLTQLQDLRHLEIRNCSSLVAMPSNIGKLTCLKTLSMFIVGSKVGCNLAELHNLQLGGKLHIKGLENVRTEWDAKEANLTAKKDLKSLYLTWGRDDNSQGNDERVLEALKPHSGLKCFGMKGYGGVQLPNWMRNTSFLKSLVEIILFGCKRCQGVPPLGKLPFLTTLFISGMKDVKYIDEDVYDPAIEKAFISLKELTLRGLPNLERMLEAEGVEMLPLLSRLNIQGVPKLSLPSLPSVEYLHACGTNKELSESLSDYHCDIGDVASFPEGIVRNMHNLKKLEIEFFHKLKVLPDELGRLGALVDLGISYCSELESFSEHVLRGMSSLRILRIFLCEKLKSLSEGMGHLTCLEQLKIENCRQLTTLPSNMNQLTSLQSLTLFDIPSLTSLPWLGAMTSLQQLDLFFCPELKSLPDSFQQLRNLHELHICECPKLAKRCKKGTGEDWQKIAQIPQLKVEAEETYFSCDIIKLFWKLRKQMIYWYTNGDPYVFVTGYEFEEMVDK